MTIGTILGALARILPVVAFLLAITVVAELCERAGVFDVVGHQVARQGRHRTWLVWLLFAGFAVVCTAVLSLDTTAVLLTPVGLALARQIGVRPRPFALTTLWVANTGSLLLPVSNLTNLLALQRLQSEGVGHARYLRLALGPGLVSIAVTLLLVALLHHRDLRSTYSIDPPAAPHDRVLLRIATGVCLLAGPGFAAGLEPWVVATVGAAVLAAATAWRHPAALRGLQLPWAMVAGFAVLTTVVAWAHQAGHLDPLVALAGSGGSTGDLLRVAGVTAVSANVVNNLPAYLALEPAGAGDPTRLMAVLVGANVGPLVTPWASLATLLWLQRCRSAGVRWRLGRLALAGAVCAVLAVAASAATLGVLRG
ncbi:SLC13 family permease [Arsenicicoccus sp. oral taxon 190]|uniref:SLC13 family permease n=1 Tax=Arsenicicoccus sp. oral taxon 190 TaxID=1658671 RepID=UPI00067A0221|nr:SLC13 family permease [Arsenicicoccus sp. oral taxon 190]AKT52276.1 arsenic transporter [Arsenicicoccus sp. oral taxon 190]